MKVLLIQPPYIDLKKNVKRCQPALGLAYLSAAIKDKHRVKVLDAVADGFEREEIIDRDYIRYGLGFEQIKREVKTFAPDVVGISCLFTTQAQNVYELCSAIKESSKNIVTIIGGAHPSAVPEEALRLRDVDYVVIGEGEEVFSALLERLEKGKEPRDLDGIGYKKNGKVVINEKKDYISDLDRIASPEWSLLPLERYFAIARPHGVYPEKKRFLPVLSSRGCPNNCIFCSVHNIWGRNYRKRSAANVLEEIGNLIDKYGAEEIYFEDDNLTLDKQRSVDIFKGMLERKFNLKWSSPNGIFIGTIDDELIDLMKISGCRALSFGMESGDRHILRDVIDKRIDLDRAARIFKKIKSVDIETSAFFVLGLPGETRKNLENTFHYARRLTADNIVFFFATPLPGTRLSDVCGKRGIRLGEIDYKMLRSENALLIPEGMSRREFLSKVGIEKMLIYIKKAFRSPSWALQKINERISHLFFA